MLRNTFVVWLALAVLIPAASFAQTPRLNRDGKVDLKVLYVGGQPDFETSGRPKQDPAVVEASVVARMASFEGFLKEKFTTVKSIRGTDYKAEMSDDYDVTIFDGRLPVLEPVKHAYDRKGNSIPPYRPRMLPHDFDRAAITIASMGEVVTRAIGSKNDWYCLCLDADAHNWVADHPIFKGPFPVKMTTKMKPTPEYAFHYTYYTGPLPDSTLMWRVQHVGYMDDPNALIGMVARPWGYVEANDSEYISSGVCGKTIDAVALGRHGNFFHWGFAAAPNNMTDEAKEVFANAVVYISQFNGKPMLVRKDNDRIATREFVKELKYLVSREAYEENQARNREYNERSLALQKAAQEKQAKGETLTQEEQFYLTFKPRPEQTLEQYLSRYGREAYAILGNDIDKYASYYDENLPYFYGGVGMYAMEIDEDCKAWGIANNDVKLLDKAISCLEKGVEVDCAKRILDRYTLCDFATAKEWRSWYKKYHKKMFFTESGGWFFMIDGPVTLPGNDFYAKKRQREEAEAAFVAAMAADNARLDIPSYQNPVCVSAKWVPGDKKGEGNIELNFALYQGFHLYKTVSDQDPYIALSVEAKGPGYGMRIGELIAPPARPFETPGTTVYDNDFKMLIPVSYEYTGPVTCTVGWQACDDKMCTAPMEKEFTVMIQ
ncbi:MAG: hypothetical protein IKX34_04355 [Bacteroidales bacterium]|nr:hypothetical protein [Bacteroidales bacterium]